MADINAVYVGAVAPVATRYDLETSNAAFNLTTATGGRLQVLYSDGTIQLWECTLGPTPPEVAITATKLRLTRLHVAGDIPAGSEGSLKAFALVDIPASTEPIRGSVFPITVLADGT